MPLSQETEQTSAARESEGDEETSVEGAAQNTGEEETSDGQPSPGYGQPTYSGAQQYSAQKGGQQQYQYQGPMGAGFPTGPGMGPPGMMGGAQQYGPTIICAGCNRNLLSEEFTNQEGQTYCIPCWDQRFAPTCSVCNKKISINEEQLYFQTKPFHRQCFRCSICHNELAGQAIVPRENNQLVCISCEERTNAVYCDKCKQAIRFGERRLLSEGKDFHERCFTCAYCSRSISGQYYLHEGQITCENCQFTRFAKYCENCKQMIKAGGLVYKQKYFHEQCFTCSKCNRTITKPTFPSKEGKPYCEECFQQTVADKCSKCSQPITQRFILYNGGKFHPQCFTCHKCSRSLENAAFYPDNGQPLCEQCSQQMQGGPIGGGPPGYPGGPPPPRGPSGGGFQQQYQSSGGGFQPGGGGFQSSGGGFQSGGGGFQSSGGGFQSSSGGFQSSSGGYSGGYSSGYSGGPGFGGQAGAGQRFGGPVGGPGFGGQAARGSAPGFGGPPLQGGRPSGPRYGQAPRNCDKCNQRIEGAWMPINGKVIHPDCFTCDQCHAIIGPHNPFNEETGKVLCMGCYQAHLNNVMYRKN